MESYRLNEIVHPKLLSTHHIVLLSSSLQRQKERKRQERLEKNGTEPKVSSTGRNLGRAGRQEWRRQANQGIPTLYLSTFFPGQRYLGWG
jgi:hypothetical protein